MRFEIHTADGRHFHLLSEYYGYIATFGSVDAALDYIINEFAT